MSLSLGVSQYSPPYAPPAVPDVHGCDLWYFMANDTADINDCKVALEFLPAGPDLVEWAINGDPLHKHDSHRLPYNSTFGTCQIEFYASGPSARELDHYLFSGDEMRQMAGYLLESCVVEAGAGGFITNGLQNTLDTVTSPRFSHLDNYPPNSTYLSLSIWNKKAYRAAWNPGDMEPAISHSIVDATYQRKEHTRIRTPAYRKAYRNYLYYQDVSNYMQRAWYDTWWAPPQPHGTAPQEPIGGNQDNLSAPMLNVTVMPVVQLNASIPGAHACQISTEQPDSSNRRCLSRDAQNGTRGGGGLGAEA